MAYVNPGWNNDASPAINAENLNSMSETLECVPVENGGTGATNVTDARINLGLSSDGIEALVRGEPLPISCGGTGAPNAAGARDMLGLNTAALLDANTVMRYYSLDAWLTENNISSTATIALNDILASCEIFFPADTTNTISDLPSGVSFSDGGFHLITFGSSAARLNRKVQILIPETTAYIYVRRRHGGTSTPWGRFTMTYV